MVKLKWGMEYKGILASTDLYMNVQVRLRGGRRGRAKVVRASAHPSPFQPSRAQLADAEEFIEGKLAGRLGEILIRCVPGLRRGGTVPPNRRPPTASLANQFSRRCNNVLYIREVQEASALGSSSSSSSSSSAGGARAGDD